MLRLKKALNRFIPASFLWRLSALNMIIFIGGLIFSGWAIYRTACFLAAGVGNLDSAVQQQFNATLLNYLWLFLIAAAITGSLFHFYLVRKLIAPIRKLIHATKELKQGHFAEEIPVNRMDEVGQLVTQYNQLTDQLRENESHRKELVSDISHEIRTPLSNLKGYLQALKDGTIEGDKEIYSALYQESSRMSQMVEQLEQLKEWDYLAKQSLLKKETQEIGAIIEQSVAMFQFRLEEERIPIVVCVDSCKLTIHLEGIQQVLSNLLDNAIRYYQGEEAIKVTGEQVAGQYVVSIGGPSNPIPETEKEKIFERFYRLDASRNRETGGAGLGLAISKEMIDSHHNGKIGVESQANKNVFWFTLPLI